MSSLIAPPAESAPEECRTCWLKVSQREVEIHDHEHEGEWKVQLAASGLCALFGILGWLLPNQTLALVCNILAYIAGSWFAADETWEKLRRREVDVHFLMLAVAAGAASIGQWSEGAVLLFLFSFAGALEHFAMERTQREIQSLIHAAPKTATVLQPDGTEREMPVEKLVPGMRLLVKPGVAFAVDAEVAKGETATDESNLTGEAAPVEKRLGDQVLAGTLNLWGVVEVITKRAAEESALQKIIKLIREAQRQKAPSQRFTDKFGSTYTLAILTLTLVMFLV